MKRLLCALLLVLFVGGVLGCKEKAPEKKPGAEETKEKPAGGTEAPK